MGTFISKVHLYKNVPLLKNTNQNILFSSKQDRDTQFSSKQYKEYTNLTYVRGEYILVPDVADIIENCNYLSYNNYDKEYYCYITHIEYENEGTSKVYFELDYFQTFIYDSVFKPCMVEREHVSDDSIGANLIDEGLPTGEYVYDEIDVDMSDLINYRYLIGSTYNHKGEVLKGGTYGRIYSGIGLLCYPNAKLTSDGINLIEEQHQGAVQFVTMIPRIAVSEPVSIDNEGNVSTGTSGSYKQIDVNVDTNSIEGYTPVNKKCLIYPYQSLFISNNEGQTNELIFEDFGNRKASFMMRSNIAPNLEVRLNPLDYKKVIENQDEGITLNNYPQCAYSTDTFKYWLTCNTPALIMGALPNVSMGVKDYQNSSGNINSVTGAFGGLNEIYQHKLTPQKASGNMGGSANITFNQKKFRFYKKHVKLDYIKSIDNYFTRFGYRVDKIKVPNLRGKNCNYVKTKGCIITGDIPIDGIENLTNMFNEGVSIWHSFNIGDY